MEQDPAAVSAQMSATADRLAGACVYGGARAVSERGRRGNGARFSVAGSRPHMIHDPVRHFLNLTGQRAHREINTPQKISPRRGPLSRRRPHRPRSGQSGPARQGQGCPPPPTRPGGGPRTQWREGAAVCLSIPGTANVTGGVTRVTPQAHTTTRASTTSGSAVRRRDKPGLCGTVSPARGHDAATGDDIPGIGRARHPKEGGDRRGPALGREEHEMPPAGDEHVAGDREGQVQRHAEVGHETDRDQQHHDDEARRPDACPGKVPAGRPIVGVDARRVGQNPRAFSALARGSQSDPKIVHRRVIVRIERERPLTGDDRRVPVLGANRDHIAVTHVATLLGAERIAFWTSASASAWLLVSASASARTRWPLGSDGSSRTASWAAATASPALRVRDAPGLCAASWARARLRSLCPMVSSGANRIDSSAIHPASSNWSSPNSAHDQT